MQVSARGSGGRHEVDAVERREEKGEGTEEEREVKSMPLHRMREGGERERLSLISFLFYSFFLYIILYIIIIY